METEKPFTYNNAILNSLDEIQTFCGPLNALLINEGGNGNGFEDVVAFNIEAYQTQLRLAQQNNIVDAVIGLGNIRIDSYYDYDKEESVKKETIVNCGLCLIECKFGMTSKHTPLKSETVDKIQPSKDYLLSLGLQQISKIVFLVKKDPGVLLNKIRRIFKFDKRKFNVMVKTEADFKLFMGLT